MKSVAFMLIFVSIFFTKKATISWLSPALFFSLFWLIFLIVPLIFAPEYIVSDYSIWFVATLITSCCSGSILATKVKILNNPIFFTSNQKIDLAKLAKPLLFFIFISVVGIIALIRFTLNLYVSYENLSLLLLPNLISIDRYNEIIYYPPYVNYSLYFIYPACILGGAIFSFRLEKQYLKIISIVPITLSIAIGFIEGTRYGILLAFTLFFSTYVASIALQNNKEQKFTLVKSFIYLIIILGVFVFLFVLIQWLRQGLDPIIIDLLILKIKSYFFGYLSAFSNWLENINSIFFINGEFSTFAGPMNLFGLIERRLGFYDPIEINYYTSTNIFTAFRGLISDFSISGAIIFVFILGFIFQFYFQKNKKNELDGILPISIFYSFIIYSPLISIFHYNSIVFSWFLIYLIFKINSLNENLANYS